MTVIAGESITSCSSPQTGHDDTRPLGSHYASPVTPPQDMPLVTLGVFCFNQARFAAECLASVANQSYPNLEIFLVDDGSCDDSVEVLRSAVQTFPELSDATVIADGTNRGLHGRMNQVLGLAKGTFVMWLAIDDVLLAGAVERLVAQVHRYPDVDVVFGDLEVMDVAGVSRGYARPRDTWQRGVAMRHRTPRPAWQGIIKVNNFVPGGMSLLRTQALARVGGYDDDIRTEDLNMWLKLGRDGRFLYAGQSVGRYRIVPGSKSRNDRAHSLDAARLCGRRLSGDPEWDAGMARLVAMRWALAVARGKGRPGVSLGEVSQVSGIPVMRLVAALPAAAARPIFGSACAAISHRFRRLREGRS